MKTPTLTAGLYVIGDGVATATAASVAALVAAYSLGVGEGSTEAMEGLGARALANWGDAE